jgi:hypothetical protein
MGMGVCGMIIGPLKVASWRQAFDFEAHHELLISLSVSALIG